MDVPEHLGIPRRQLPERLLNGQLTELFLLQLEGLCPLHPQTRLLVYNHDWIHSQTHIKSSRYADTFDRAVAGEEALSRPKIAEGYPGNASLTKQTQLRR